MLDGAGKASDIKARIESIRQQAEEATRRETAGGFSLASTGHLELTWRELNAGANMSCQATASSISLLDTQRPTTSIDGVE